MARKILKFYSETCPPCQGLNMILNGGDIGFPIESYDTDDPNNRGMMEKYNILPVPCLVLVNGNGDEVKRRIGGANNIKEITEWFK
jgi:thiol-disulfide isomerase/thioredoxin